MIALTAIEERLNAWTFADDTPAAGQADALLQLGENVLENWIAARDETPTSEDREGFRLLALHRQGAKGDPSFNACRETCRELAYRYNRVVAEDDGAAAKKLLEMMARLAHHLVLFVSGKMQAAQLGEFCCSSKALRRASAHD